MRIRYAAAILALAAGTTGVGFALATATSAHPQNDAPLVYICPGVQNAQPQNCQNTQELEVFDTKGAPIYSVGETGRAGRRRLAAPRPGRGA